ncbi:carboxylesterase/lipase family protein [Roseateles toxinivorans]|uniref:Carboxylic ester hydrolase n=1 Tax=Roseateles toxinivorans TaxID=270368 RepID=A0A4R6QP49_9BURK|nr:carboxylesterase family protein [Roseateles toxinivorans]TDP72262.1 para-nitrobenzyl esterase [Roseateles toxinivorans]
MPAPHSVGALTDRLVAPGATVNTAAGAVRGYQRGGVHCFKGLAYAGAPTAEHRFRRAPDLAAWTGVRNAYNYGPVCPRWTAPADLSNNEWAFLLQRGAESAAQEDCLRINVWTSSTRPEHPRPVMLWLHGQGFMSGSSQDFLATDGENLARTQEVVVMSLNHRVGPLGLLHLGELSGAEYADSGNAGMIDIIDALRWVRTNAEAFGGDPDNVTLFGQSGGGFKISVLLAMPEARGLFHKAIIQSGARLRVHTSASATVLTERTLQRLAINSRTGLSALQCVPLNRLLQAAQDASMEMAPATPDDTGYRNAPGFYWMPVAGVPSLPTQPVDPDAPEQSRHVPLLVGTTLNEFAPCMTFPGAETLTWAELPAKLAPQLGDRVTAAIAAVRAIEPSACPVDVWSVLGGRRFRQAAVALCDARVRQQQAAPVFNYLFRWRTAMFEGRPGAFHCACLPFVFNNTDLCDHATGGDSRAQRLATRMSRAWAQFARTGHPGHDDLPAWPAFTPCERAVMVFDDHCQVARNLDTELLALLPGN